MASLLFRRSIAPRHLLIALMLSAGIATGCKSSRQSTIAARPPVTQQTVQPVAPPAMAPTPQQAAQQTAAIEPLPPTSSETAAEEVLPAEVLLSLDEAVATSLQDNPRLRQMAAHAQAARFNTDVAFAPFLPEIGTGFRYSAFNVPVLPGGTFVPASLSGGVNSFVIAEAGVQYTLIDFGRRTGHYTQAVNQARMQEMAWIRARQTIAFEAAQAYFRLLAAQVALAVREEAVVDAESILADTNARRANGTAERETVLRAEVEVSQTRQNLLGARQQVRDAEATLNVVMGRPAQLPLRVTDVTAQPRFQQSLEDCIGWAANDRREIRIAREAVAEAQGGVQAARGELLPKIFVRGTVLRADSAGPLNGFVEGIGVHAEQAIYAGGRYRGDLRRNQALVTGAYAGLQAILDNVSLQVNVAFQAIETDRQRIELGEATIAQARENLRLVTVRYNNGNATPTDIVDAQTAMVQSETEYFTAVYGYLEGLARLDYALGGNQQRLLEQLRLAATAAQEQPVQERLPQQ
jgi:outer membrane protein TolC